MLSEGRTQSGGGFRRESRKAGGGKLRNSPPATTVRRFGFLLPKFLGVDIASPGSVPRGQEKVVREGESCQEKKGRVPLLSAKWFLGGGSQLHTNTIII